MSVEDRVHRSADNSLAHITGVRDDLGEQAMIELIQSQTAAGAMAYFQTFGPDARLFLSKMHETISVLEQIISETFP